MSDVNEGRNIQDEGSSGADGLGGFPKETGTERSEVEDRGFKSHPRRFSLNPLPSQLKGDMFGRDLCIQKPETRLPNINHPLAMNRTFSPTSFSVNPSRVGAF
jgi:hypothetical protein